MVTTKLPRLTRLPGLTPLFAVFLAAFLPLEMLNVGSVAFAQEKTESLLSRALKNRENSNVKNAVDENAKQIFEDYPNVKKRAIRSELTAIFAAIAAAIGLIIQWIYSRGG